MLSGKCRRDKSANNILPALDFLLHPTSQGFWPSFTSFRSWGDPSRGTNPLLPPCLGSLKSLDPKRGPPLHVGLGRRSRDWCFHGQWWQDVCACVCASVGVCAWFALFRELRVGDGGGRWREGCQVQCDPVVRRTRR